MEIGYCHVIGLGTAIERGGGIFFVLGGLVDGLGVNLGIGVVLLEVSNELGVNTDGPSNDTHDVLSVFQSYQSK
jgi:hypothetical protein